MSQQQSPEDKREQAKQDQIAALAAIRSNLGFRALLAKIRSQQRSLSARISLDDPQWERKTLARQGGEVAIEELTAWLQARMELPADIF